MDSRRFTPTTTTMLLALSQRSERPSSVRIPWRQGVTQPSILKHQHHTESKRGNGGTISFKTSVTLSDCLLSEIGRGIGESRADKAVKASKISINFGNDIASSRACTEHTGRSCRPWHRCREAPSRVPCRRSAGEPGRGPPQPGGGE